MRLAARMAAALNGIVGARDVPQNNPRLYRGLCPKPGIGVPAEQMKTKKKSVSVLV